MIIGLELLGYIDPVSGTLLIQVIVAGVVGFIGFFHKSIWKGVHWVTGRRNDDGEDASS